MTDFNKTWGFTTAMLDFFGKKPGQSTTEFAAELKALTVADREEFKQGLIRIGYKITTEKTA